MVKLVIMDMRRFDELEPDLLETLHRIAQGDKYANIAADLNLVEITIKKRVKRAIIRLGARDRDDAVLAFVLWNRQRQRYNEGVISHDILERAAFFPDLPEPEERPVLEVRDSAGRIETDPPFLPDVIPARHQPQPSWSTQLAKPAAMLLGIPVVALLLVLILLGSDALMEKASKWGWLLSH